MTHKRGSEPAGGFSQGVFGPVGFDEPGTVTALPESSQGLCGYSRGLLFLPEAIGLPGSEEVFQMVLQVRVRWGTSMCPCHLPFPRSYFHAANPGRRCLALCPVPGVLFDIAACAPCPLQCEKSEAPEAVEVPPNRGSGPASHLHLSSLCLPCSSRVAKHHSVISPPKDSRST